MSATKPDLNATNPAISRTAAMLLTVALVVGVREAAVGVCATLGYASAANIVGMLTLFALLIVWRYTVGLPNWLTQTSNTLLLESGFAFLPIATGAGLLMFRLGDAVWGVSATIAVSTLLPLWGLAALASLWLSAGSHSESTH